jgi:hypothetical protein
MFVLGVVEVLKIIIGVIIGTFLFACVFIIWACCVVCSRAENYEEIYYEDEENGKSNSVKPNS